MFLLGEGAGQPSEFTLWAFRKHCPAAVSGLWLPLAPFGSFAGKRFQTLASSSTVNGLPIDWLCQAPLLRLPVLASFPALTPGILCSSLASFRAFEYWHALEIMREMHHSHSLYNTAMIGSQTWGAVNTWISCACITTTDINHGPAQLSTGKSSIHVTGCAVTILV